MPALSLKPWNWQLPDWPRFRWDAKRLASLEQQFLRESGVFIGSVNHLLPEERDQLTIEAMTTAAATTSEIEGEILDRASVQSSIRKQLGLASSRNRVKPAEQGIARMTVDLYRRCNEPLSQETLFSWHDMLMQGRGDIGAAGRYRSGLEPMQVISGPMHAPKVHFEAPPSTAVAYEMARFVEWFNCTAPGGDTPLPTVTRAGTAHLYFVSVHPFEDGNGRVGRAIAEKALFQGSGQPTLIALAATILDRRKAYYAELEAANESNEITQWLIWFAATAIEAQQQTIASIEFLIEKAKLLNYLRGQLNARQEKALLRILREGPGGFRGGLSAGNYMRITGASPATTTRDLADLVAKGALTRKGDLRYARYTIAIPPRPASSDLP